MNRRISEEELKESYRQRTARSSHGGRDCPQEDVLQKAVSGSIVRDERTRLVNHLRTCSDCTREYRILRMIEPWARELREAGGENSANTAGIGGPGSRGMRDWMDSSRLLPAAATACLLVLIALGAWMALLIRESDRMLERLRQDLQTLERNTESLQRSSGGQDVRREPEPRADRPGPEVTATELAALRRQAADASRPQFNTPIVDLDPGAVTRGDAAQPPTGIRVPRGSSTFVLILHVSGERTFPGYSLEIRDARQKIVWQGEGLQAAAENTFTVLLSRSLLAEGEYRLRLYGSARGSSVLVESYALKVDYE